MVRSTYCALQTVPKTLETVPRAHLAAGAPWVQEPFRIIIKDLIIELDQCNGPAVDRLLIGAAENCVSVIA
jgi:hypothetical protein